MTLHQNSSPSEAAPQNSRVVDRPRGRGGSRVLLQWIGLASIVGACLFVAAGVFQIQDKLEITISEATDGTEVDPIGLLGDDVATLRRDFQEFGSALGGGLQQLADHLEEGRAEDLARLELRIATLRGEISRLTEREAELSGRVRGLTAAVARMPVGATLAEGTNPSVVFFEEAPHEETSRPAEAEPAPVAEAPRRKGFLSFDLPTGAFEFDAAQRFQVIGSLSRVGFDAKSTLHDFTGVTSSVSGEFSLALGRPELGCSGRIEVAAKTLKTGVDGRDEEMRAHLHAEENPTITFVLEDLVADAIDRDARTVSGTAVGTMTIAGHAESVRVPVTLSVDESRRVAVSGEHSFEMSTFGVEPPSQLGMIKVEDEVRVWLELRARAVGAAELHAKASS